MTVTDRVIQLETKYKLNSFEINGFHPWTYTRRNIMSVIFSQLYFNKSQSDFFCPRSDQHISIWGKATEKAKFYLHSLRVLLGRKGHLRKNVDILFVASPRRQLVDGKYECIYTDDLAEFFSNSISLERKIEGMHHTPVRTKNLVYYDEVILFKRLVHKLTEKHLRKRKIKYSDVYNQILVRMEKPLKELFDGYDMDLSIESWVHEMSDRYFRYRIYSKIYESLLRKVNPRLIIEVCHYDFHNMVLNEVAKKLGITTIELQHGVVYVEHFAYNYPPDIKIPQFPDYFFVFSDYWKELIRCPIDKDKIISVGYPFYDRNVRRYKRCISTGISEDKVIVFLSSPGYKLDKLIIDATNRLAESGWKIVFKLHPREYSDWKNIYPALAGSDIEVIDTHERTLYEVFSVSSAVVGVFSTTIFEAIGFGLAALIFDISDYEHVDDLCDKGFAAKVYDSDSLCAALRNLDEEHQDRSAIFFKPIAIENMKSVILSLLHDKTIFREETHDKG